MTIQRLIFLCCIVSCSLFGQTSCLPVTGDQILSGDLARAVPAFAGISAKTPVAATPVPGGSRVFSPSELQSLAARFSVTIGPMQEICFRLATEPLNRERVEEAMRKGLGIPDATIEILETSSGPVPVGVIEFTRADLGVPAAPDQLAGEMWRGAVVYAATHRFPVWAKVRITAPFNRLVALDALHSGVAIKSGQIRSENGRGFPAASASTLTVEQVAGMMPLRSIAAGGEIRVDNLTHPNDVNRGDLVQVEVHFGAAHLATTGRAETAGHIGDSIAVRNPETSKLFQAIVEGSGKVLVGQPGIKTARKEGY